MTFMISNDMSIDEHEQIVEEGLIGVEDPGFISSSFSDHEGNSSLEVSIQPQNSRRVIVSNVELACSSLPPPASVQCFSDAVRMQLVQNLSQKSSAISLKEFKNFHMQTLTNDRTVKQNMTLGTIEKRKEKQAEIQALKDSIAKLSDQKQKLRDQLATTKPSCEKKVKEAKKAMLTAERIFKTSEDKLKSKIQTRDKLKERLDNLKRSFEAVELEDQQLSMWLTDHSIKIDFAAAEDNSPESSSGLIVELYNVNPNKPEEKVFILIDSIIPQTGHFTVKSVYPDFEDAYSVVKRANATKDFLQLLRDCRRNWQQMASSEEQRDS